MQLATLAAFSGGGERAQEHRDQFDRAVADDGADIQRVADLAVEGVIDGRLEAGGIGAGVGEEPGAARAMQADRGSGLAGDGAQLGHGGA